MDSLPKVYDELLEAAQDGLAAAAYGPDAEEAGRVYEDLADAFEGLAIGAILLEYDAERFRQRLVHAANARRQFYQVCLRDEAAPPTRARSRTGALFCAIASRYAPLVRELVRLPPADWILESEYEDDFCYHALVGREAAPEAAGALPEAGALLDRFEAALEGAASPRLDLCRALAAADPAAFREAFADLLVEREAWVEALQTARSDQPPFLMARHVFVEGLALLALAEARGWPMPDRYAFCPEPARLGPPTATPDDLLGDLVPMMRTNRRARGLPT